MRDIKALYEQREKIRACFKDTSRMPRLDCGLIPEKTREKYANILFHNEVVASQLKAFNARLSKEEKQALSKYHRSLNWTTTHGE